MAVSDVARNRDGQLDPGGRRPDAPRATPGNPRRQRLMLLLVLAVCLAPVVASYLLYYVFPPAGRSNYGDLIEPQRPVPPLRLGTLDGEPYTLDSLKGQWVLLHADQAACGSGCAEKLFMIRQLRTMTGKDRTRIERVWLVTDEAAVDPRIPPAYEGTVMLRGDREQLVRWLPVPDGARIEDFFYVVDPLGNLMMRYPRDADPAKVRKDLGKLLKASRVG